MVLQNCLDWILTWTAGGCWTWAASLVRGCSCLLAGPLAQPPVNTLQMFLNPVQSSWSILTGECKTPTALLVTLCLDGPDMVSEDSTFQGGKLLLFCSIPPPPQTKHTKVCKGSVYWIALLPPPQEALIMIFSLKNYFCLEDRFW